MPKTRSEIVLRLFDSTALSDALYSSTDIQPFVDLTDLKLPFDEPSNYATLENDNWKLDGSKSIFPDDLTTLQYGYWSASQSNGLGVLNVPFSINFSFAHSTYGITFYFYKEDFATSINVKWYDALDVLLLDKTFTNTKSTFFADGSVVDYKRVEVTFLKNNQPGHYIKLNEIGFGAEILFEDSEIKNCNIVEELNVTSDELSVNKMTAKIFVEDADYIQSIYQVLQDQQKMIASVYIDDVQKEMGTFYLTTRENPSENEIIFNTEDIIGVMSNETYLGGFVNDTFENVVNDIMGSFGTALFTIDDDIKSLPISGYIPITDFRRAIQLVAFSVNAVVDCSRSDKVNIYRLATTTPQTISKSKYFIGSNQKELERVTTVSLALKSYEIATGTDEVYKVTHQTGTYTALFDAPYSSLAITGATITDSDVNYATFTVVTPGVVTITGTAYTESKQVFVVQTAGLSPTAILKTVEFENSIIWNGQSNTQYLYDRLINLNERNVKILLDDESAGDYLSVDALYNKTIEGYATSVNIDLSGGFIGQTKIEGVIV